MSLRLVSSARNLREQFKGTPASSVSSASASSNLSASSTSSIFDPSSPSQSGSSMLSRQNSLLRSTSNGNLRRSKSQKKNIIAKVFTDDSGYQAAPPDLSMEMTLLIVKRCVKEIRERGLTTKGILRQVSMGQSQKVIFDTIRLILDDDASTELSALRQVDIHLVAHAMKWAIRYSQETLVTHADYQALYLDQDRSFSRFVSALPSTHRSILLDLFSLCADVTSLDHLNNMPLVSVAKAISLSIMAEPDHEFTTFDASLQQRNMWGAACEDLLRAFLRIKTTHDLAKIEQEDDIDENRFVDNVTRKVRSARQRSNENGSMPAFNQRADVSVPSSAGSAWPGVMTPTGNGRSNASGYFDQVVSPRSSSPHSQGSAAFFGASLSRSHSLAKSTTSRSRPLSPAPYYEEALNYEEIMQDRANLNRLRQTSPYQGPALRPGEITEHRRSSFADMESLYTPAAGSTADGYESEPDLTHLDPSLDLGFADGLGWDMASLDKLHSLDDLQSDTASTIIHRSNSTSTQGSASIRSGLTSQNDNEDDRSPPLRSTKARVGHAISPGHTSPAVSPQRAKRNSLLRRSVSLDPHTMQGRIHKRHELRQDLLSRDLSIHAERSQVSEDLRQRLLQVRNQSSQAALSNTNGGFSLESSPQDLERPAIPTRGVSHGLGRSMSRSSAAESKLEISTGSLPDRNVVGESDAQSELTPVSNPSSSSSIASPKRHQELAPLSMDKKPEPAQRPKEVEVCVHFTPITPVSPKADLRSKFHDTFPERPSSPAAAQNGEASSSMPRRSPIGTGVRGAQSGKVSPIPSAVSSPYQALPQQQKSMSRANKSQALPLPNTPTYSSSTIMSSPSQHAVETKSKAAGFIRALSHKLRSKQSDEQLKPVKINNHVVGSPAPSTPAAPVPTTPTVSIQPPRLELSFLGEVAVPSSAASASAAVTSSIPSKEEVVLQPASAPALLHLSASSNSGPAVLESWRRAAQANLPTASNSPSTNPSSPNNYTSTSNSTEHSGGDLSPRGFTGARRSSGTLFGSGNIAIREVRRKSKLSMSTPRGAMGYHPGQATSTKADGNRGARAAIGSVGAGSPGRSPRRSRNERISSDGYTTDDSTPGYDGTSTHANNDNDISNGSGLTGTGTDVGYDGSGVAGATSPSKKSGGREYRFSTATLLKDGKLYYQLQWDQFSEIGFKSEFFTEPEQYLTGLSQKRASKATMKLGGGLGGSTTTGLNAMMMTTTKTGSTTTTTSRDHPTHNRRQSSSSLGQAQGQVQGQVQGRNRDPGPTPAQKAAALKAARESFMALAKDPKALAALKAGSTGGIGQATIIGTGSFPIGSEQPIYQSRPLNLNSTAATGHSSGQSSSRRHSRGQPLQSVKEHAENDKHPKNMSAKLSQVSSAAGTGLQESKKAMSKPGTLSTGAVGVSSSPSSQAPPNQFVHKDALALVGGGLRPPTTSNVSATSAASAPKAPKKNRIFGVKLRSSKKNNRLSTNLAVSPNSSNIGSSPSNAPTPSSSKKKRMQGMAVFRRDVMTKTEESLDEVFPWTCVEHMAGQESDWVMLEPVQDGAVGWIKIDRLEEEMARFAVSEQRQQEQKVPQQDRTHHHQLAREQ